MDDLFLDGDRIVDGGVISDNFLDGNVDSTNVNLRGSEGGLDMYNGICWLDSDFGGWDGDFIDDVDLGRVLCVDIKVDCDIFNGVYEFLEIVVEPSSVSEEREDIIDDGLPDFRDSSAEGFRWTNVNEAETEACEWVADSLPFATDVTPVILDIGVVFLFFTFPAYLVSNEGCKEVLGSGSLFLSIVPELFEFFEDLRRVLVRSLGALHH